MKESKDFIKAVLEKLPAEDTKYITAKKTGKLGLLIRIRSKSKEGKILEHSRTVSIRQFRDEKSILSALKRAKKIREELYFELFGVSLNEWLARSKNTDSKKIYRDTTTDNQTGYPSVFLHIAANRYGAYFKGFLVSVNKINKKVFNFGRDRTEDEAFIEACKKSDEWHGRPLKENREYLKRKKEIDWEEKVGKRKNI